MSASGFSASESLVVTECANRGSKTGPGDCNLDGVLSVMTSSSGTFEKRFTVQQGPFGSDKVVCGKPYPCIVSVTQPVLSPTEEADAPISF